MAGGLATLRAVENLHRRKGTSLVLHRDGVTDVSVMAKLFGASGNALSGSMADTVRRVRITNAAIAAAAWPGPPRKGDTIGDYLIDTVDTRNVGDVVVLHIIDIATAL